MDLATGVLVVATPEGEITLPVVELVLSERNLKTLLLNIEDEDNSVSRMTEEGVMMVIRAEPNEVHYKDRAAGLMDEATEAKLLAEELGANETLFIPPDFNEKLN